MELGDDPESTRDRPDTDIPAHAKLTNVERLMVGFEQDEHGDWVALLDCGHRQHVRHQPPWQERAWVVSAEGRESRVGQPLECPLCDGEGETEAADEGGAVRDDGTGHRPGRTGAPDGGAETLE